MGNEIPKAIFLPFVFLFGLLLLFFDSGLAHYCLIWQQINRLSGTKREIAEKEFYLHDDNKYLWAGTLARINRWGNGGVWLWSHQGLKYFPTSADTLFAYCDVCEVTRNNAENFQVDNKSRKTTIEIQQWARWVMAGDFVQLIVSTPDKSVRVGEIKEIDAYSLPLFLPLELERLCQR